MRKLAYKVEELSWDRLPSSSVLRKLCFCLSQSWWQNFYWLWRSQNQSLFPYNSVNFGLKSTYSTTKFIWRKLQNIAPCRRSVRLLTAILYHQRQINLLGKNRQVTCMVTAFILRLYFQFIASKPQSGIVEISGCAVCLHRLFILHVQLVCVKSEWIWLFQGMSWPECFLSRHCNLQILEIMLWCWWWEVWENLPNTIKFFYRFWLSWCNEVLYQQCTVSACIMMGWKSSSSLICEVNILTFLLVFFGFVSFRFGFFCQGCRHIHMLLWAEWRWR